MNDNPKVESTKLKKGFSNKKVFIPFFYLLLFIFYLPSVGAEPLIALKGHISPQIHGAILVGKNPSDETISLSLLVNIDPAQMDQALHDIYGPGGSRRFLRPYEFAERFGVADKRRALKDFAAQNGWAVDNSRDNPRSMIVKVSARSGDIEKTLHIQLNRYQLPDGRVFRAHETDPQIPASIAPHLSAIFGLSNVPGILRPHLRMPSAIGASPRTLSGTSGPNNGLSPSDIKTIYGLSSLPSTMNGSGQTIALLELDGYAPSDIQSYKTRFNLSGGMVTPVSVDNVPNLCGKNQNQPCNSQTLQNDGGMGEVALDIEMALALAPDAAIRVYISSNTNQAVIDAYDAIATEDIAKVVSTSWGMDEQDLGETIINKEAVFFQEMALQGQTVFAASGDNGAYDCYESANRSLQNQLCVDDPASQPWVTGAGGTSLSGSVSDPAETTWNNGSASKGASGGGVSTVWPISNSATNPGYSFQMGVAGTASQQARNVPDVALNADPESSPYSVYVGAGWDLYGGTSAAAPLWAALTALINQQRASLSQDALGFANPVFYETTLSAAAYTYVFNDVTTGNNLYYSAHAGYDNATGLGSFKGAAMISFINGTPFIFSLNPAASSPGGPAFNLTVNGMNFVSGSSVTWNGSPLPTTYFSSTQLQAYVSAAYIAAAGQAQIGVTNPGPITTLSPMVFSIQYPGYVTALSNVYAFPNPWDIRHNSAHRFVTFANVPAGAVVKIFTISGFLVKTIDVPISGAIWDLTNDSGRNVASGLYFYLISNGDSTTTGKIAIIK
jgi:kumamolisin